MQAKEILTEEIENLRKNFHIKLSKKRGLKIRSEDFLKIRYGKKDEEIQQSLERLSFIRRMVSFLKSES